VVRPYRDISGIFRGTPGKGHQSETTKSRFPYFVYSLTATAHAVAALSLRRIKSGDSEKLKKTSDGSGFMGISKALFRVKPVGIDHSREKQSLKRVMGSVELTFLGVGAIIGTGIFVLTGVAAALYAGPAVIISFVISGFAATLAALCYSEMAQRLLFYVFLHGGNHCLADRLEPDFGVPGGCRCRRRGLELLL
jgi:hypothetical protein